MENRSEKDNTRTEVLNNLGGQDRKRRKCAANDRARELNGFLV